MTHLFCLWLLFTVLPHVVLCTPSKGQFFHYSQPAPVNVTHWFQEGSLLLDYRQAGNAEAPSVCAVYGSHSMAFLALWSKDCCVHCVYGIWYNKVQHIRLSTTAVSVLNNKRYIFDTHLILTALASPFLHLCCLLSFIQVFSRCSPLEFGPSWPCCPPFTLLAAAIKPVALLLSAVRRMQESPANRLYDKIVYWEKSSALVSGCCLAVGSANHPLLP